jgi:hypothetical protein
VTGRHPCLSALLAGAALVACTQGNADEPDRDPAAEVMDAERYRVSTLTNHLPAEFAQLAHRDYRHIESNGTERTADAFAGAMRACGKLGQRPTGPMVPGGGFYFASHDIAWETVSVRFPSPDVAVVTGAYSNVLGRCLAGEAGGTVVVEPTVPKPARFSRIWVYVPRKDSPGAWQMYHHAATVVPQAPTAAMPVVPAR